MDLLRYIFHGICHQEAGRALESASFSMPVCSRCAGLYVGFFFALPFFFVLARRGRRAKTGAFVAGAIIAAAAWGGDGLGNFAGLWETPNAVRFFTGVMLGLFLSPFIASLFGETVGGEIRTGSRPRWRTAVILILTGALAAAGNIYPTTAYLVFESWAAAVGLVMLLAVVHTALALLVLKTRPAAAAGVAAVTVPGQLVFLSTLRSVLGL
jgi:uncharacterized membrane protein